MKRFVFAVAVMACLVSPTQAQWPGWGPPNTVFVQPMPRGQVFYNYSWQSGPGYSQGRYMSYPLLGPNSRGMQALPSFGWWRNYNW
jgi:hypothetical protein